MEKDKHAVVLRILDDQNRLTQNADTKAVALLSTLGIFSVFFIALFKDVPVDPLSIALLVIYFGSVLLAIVHIVLTISPRIRLPRRIVQKNGVSRPGDISPQPTFFGGISQFPTVEAYKKCLEETCNSEEALTDNYIDQVYQVARINSSKYYHVKYAVWLAVMAIVSQLALVTYTFVLIRR
jgi:hypothetical protein